MLCCQLTVNDGGVGTLGKPHGRNECVNRTAIDARHFHK